MLVGSNYLDHHWLWDGLAGIALAAVAVWLSGKLLGKQEDSVRPVTTPEAA
jgi:membrane-associated phospholipid phosphatase